MKKIKKSLALIPISGTLVVGAFFGIKALNNNNNIYNQSVTTMLQDEPSRSTNVEADNNWTTLEDAYLGLWDKLAERGSGNKTSKTLKIELNQNIMFTGFGDDEETPLSRNFEQTIVNAGKATDEAAVQKLFKNVEIDMNGHVVQSTINIDEYIERDVQGTSYEINNFKHQFEVPLFSKLENITFKNGSFVNIPFFANESIDSSFINVEFIDANVSGLGVIEASKESGSYKYDIKLPSEDIVSLSIFINKIENNDFINVNFTNEDIVSNTITFVVRTGEAPSEVGFNLFASSILDSNFTNVNISDISFSENNLVLDSLGAESNLYNFDVINTMKNTNFHNFMVDQFVINNNWISPEASGTHYDLSIISNLSDTDFFDFVFKNWNFSNGGPRTLQNDKAINSASSVTFNRGYLDTKTVDAFTEMGITIESDEIITEDQLAQPETVEKAAKFNDEIWTKTFNEDNTLLTDISLKSFVNLNQVEYIIPMITSNSSEGKEVATFADYFNSSFISDSEISEANSNVLESGTVGISIYGKDGKIEDLTKSVSIEDESTNGLFSSQLTYETDIVTFGFSKKDDASDIEKTVTHYDEFDTYASNHIINFEANDDAKAQELSDANTYAGLLYGNSFTDGPQTLIDPKAENEIPPNLSNGIDFTEYNDSIQFSTLAGEEQQIVESPDGKFNIDNLGDMFEKDNQNDVEIESNLNLTFSLNSINPEVNGSFSFSLGNLLNPAISNNDLNEDLISKFNTKSAGESIQKFTSRLDTLTSTLGKYTLDNLTHNLISLSLGAIPRDDQTLSSVEKITMEIVNGETIELSAAEILPDGNPASKVEDYEITEVTNNSKNVDVNIKTETMDDSGLREEDNFSYVIHYAVLDVNGVMIPGSEKDQQAKISGENTIISIDDISENETIVITNIKLIQVLSDSSTKTVESTLSSKMVFIQHKFLLESPPTPRNSTYIVITTMSVLLLLVLLISMFVIFKTSSKNKVVAEGLEDELGHDIDSDEV